MQEGWAESAYPSLHAVIAGCNPENRATPPCGLLTMRFLLQGFSAAQAAYCPPHPSHPMHRFIFQTFFDCFGFARLIILEDDMLLAPDFFPYFLGLGRLMDADPSLYCVSSWNDHGQVPGLKWKTGDQRTA